MRPIASLTLSLTIAIGTLCVQLPAPSSLCNPGLDIESLYHKDEIFRLFARQTQCQSTCSIVDSVLVNGTCSPTQCCTNSFAQSFLDCFVCIARASSQTDYYYTKAQRILDDLVVACAARGFLVNQLTFPSQNPDRTLSLFFLGPTQPGNAVHIQPTPEPPAFSILPISPASGIPSNGQSSSLTTTATTSIPRTSFPLPTSAVQSSGACRFNNVRVNVLGLLIVTIFALAP